jgi:hypothetical protein
MHLNGSPYNGQARKYFIPSSDGTAVYVGDVVKLAGSADTDGTCPTVALCGVTDVPVGIVVAVERNADNLGITGLYRAASTARYVWVADSPDLIMEAEASDGTPAATEIGLNVSHATGTPSTTTARSGAYIDFDTDATTSTLNFQIVGFVSRPDNEVGASAKLLVRFNVHQYGSVGTTGV